MKNKKYPHLKELFHTDKNAYFTEWRKLNPSKFVVKDEWRKLDDYIYTELPSDVIPVPDYPTYYVQPNGSVWRDTRGVPSAVKTGKERILKLRATYTPKNGYWLIQPYKNSKKKAIYLHRFILTAFKGPAPEGKMECHHIDHDTSNNAIDNLMWVSRQENVDFVPHHHRTVSKKTLETGRALSNSKWSSIYPQIIELLNLGTKPIDIVSKLNIPAGSIYAMIKLAKKRNN
jgi:hypothetical protein